MTAADGAPPDGPGADDEPGAAEAPTPVAAPAPAPGGGGAAGETMAAPRRRRLVRWLVALGGVVAVAAAVLVGVGWWYAHAIQGELETPAKRAVVAEARAVLGTEAVPGVSHPHPPRERASAPGSGAPPRRSRPPVSRDAQTWLLIGADMRPGEATGRSDTLILARMDPGRATLSLLAIPRDLRVEIPGVGTDKINAAFAYGGARLALQTVRDTFGVRIDHFAILDFSGFQALVGELGGVWLPVDRDYHHVNDGTAAGNWSSIDIDAGYQLLSAEDALAYVRFRHTDSDYHRGARQQLFLRELRRQVSDRSAVDLVRLLRPAARMLTTDVTSLRRLVGLAEDLLDVPASRIVRVQVQGADVDEGGVYYFASSPDEIARSVDVWLQPFGPEPARGVDGGDGAPAPRPRARPTAQPLDDAVERRPLVPDGGEARAALAALGGTGLRLCAPTLRPAALDWDEEDVRAYEQRGHRFAALTGHLELEGDAVLVVYTDWADAPLLRDPSETVEVGGRRLALWWEGPALRQVAFRAGSTHVTVLNTVRDSLAPGVLQRIAASCR